jgi:Na+-driven multidrug efflux pump
LLLGGFVKDPEATAVAVLFLQMVSLNLVAQGLIFACSSMFQGLGNTKPVLLSSGVRLITYALPVIWLSGRPDFRIEQVWYISIATTTLQAGLSLWLLRLELRKRLTGGITLSGARHQDLAVDRRTDPLISPERL